MITTSKGLKKLEASDYATQLYNSDGAFNGNVDVLEALLDKKIEGPVTLWSGNWSSGSITVPDTDRYNYFGVLTTGGVMNIVAKNGATGLRGCSGYWNTDNDALYVEGFVASHNGDIWTWVACAGLYHYATASNSVKNSRSVTAIYGLI